MNRKTKPRKQTPVYNDTGVVIGKMRYMGSWDYRKLANGRGPRGTFYLEKNVKPEHKLRKPEGWAVDTKVLEQLREYAYGHAEDARIMLHITEDDGSKSQLDAMLTRFDEHGIEIDRGHGKQIVLPDKHWSGGRWIDGEYHMQPSLQAKLL